MCVEQQNQKTLCTPSLVRTPETRLLCGVAHPFRWHALFMAESLGLNTTSSTAACLKRSLGQSSTGHVIISANSLPRGSNRERSVGMSAFGGIPLLRRYSRHCSADHFVLDVQAMRFSCEHYSLLRRFDSATISPRSLLGVPRHPPLRIRRFVSVRRRNTLPNARDASWRLPCPVTVPMTRQI